MADVCDSIDSLCHGLLPTGTRSTKKKKKREAEVSQTTTVTISRGEFQDILRPFDRRMLPQSPSVFLTFSFCLLHVRMVMVLRLGLP